MTRTLAKARARGRKAPKSALVGLYPLALEKRYTVLLDRRMNRLVRAVVQGVRDLRRDAVIDDLQATLALVERVGIAHETTFIAAGPRDVARLGTSLTQWQDRAQSRFLGSVLDVDPRRFEFRPLGSRVNTWAAENVRLIRNAEETFLQQAQDQIVTGWAEGKDTREIAKDLEVRGKVARSRARLIARDQVATLNYQVARDRQEGLGLEEYKWTTSLDERVRDDHADRHGKTFRWDTPPEDGHPGEAINCRCVATPIVPEDLDLFS